MTDIAYDDAMEEMEQDPTCVPIAIPVREGVLHLGIYHPRGRDMETLAHPDRKVRAAMAASLLTDLWERWRAGLDG